MTGLMGSFCASYWHIPGLSIICCTNSGRLAMKGMNIMEVTMNKQSMEGYALSELGEAITEESMDTIVPDSFPDAETISGCWANLTLRNKECAAGRAMVSGSAKANVVYEPADGTAPRTLSMTMPFNLEYYAPSITEDSRLMVCLSLAAAEGRVVNSRKLQVRLTIGAQFFIYDRTEAAYCTQVTCDSPLELQSQELSVLMCSQIREKSFAISDELQLDPGKPSISDILLYELDLVVNDKKMVGSKLVFKGDAVVAVAYRSPEDAIDSQRFVLPFSQMMDFDGADENCDPVLALVPTSVELQISDDYTESLNRFQLDMGITAQAILMSRETIAPVTDAYSTQRNCQVKTAELKYTSLLDALCLERDLREDVQADEPVSRVLMVSVGLPKRETQHSCGQLTMKQVVEAMAFCQGSSGKVFSVKKRMELPVTMAMADNSRANIRAGLRGAPNASAMGSTIALDIPLFFEVEVFADDALDVVEAMELAEEAYDPKLMPSARILLRAQGNLWQTAKKYKAKMADIMAVNGIEDKDEDLAGRMLLIPKARGGK